MAFDPDVARVGSSEWLDAPRAMTTARSRMEAILRRRVVGDRMEISRSTQIAAPADAVPNVITDIENAAARIRGIRKIEVIQPGDGARLVGLKWRETRIWRGRDAVEVMWITDAEPSSYYVTRAESHGSVYTARMSLDPGAGGTKLTMSFEARPVTLGAKVLWALTGWMAKGPLTKTIDQDLADIKAAVEGSAPRG